MEDSANKTNEIKNLGKLLLEGPTEPKAKRADARDPAKALERLIEGLERARWQWMTYK